MDVRITKTTGEQFLLSEHDVIVRDFIVTSIQLVPFYATVEGRSGTVDMGTEYGPRTITVPFYISGDDLLDFALLRDLMFNNLGGRDSFYIEEMRRVRYGEGESELVTGKRYKVRLNNPVTLEQQFRYGFGELEFITTELPFGESVLTTQEIQQQGINSDQEAWAFGMGLMSEDETWKYTHNSTSFKIFNAGNVPINPFEQYLKVTIRGVTGSSSYFQLRNITNGTQFRTIGQVADSQVIMVDGPIITSNGIQYFRNTTKEFIELEPGWNDFIITGATGATVEFDFRFYYK